MAVKYSLLNAQLALTVQNLMQFINVPTENFGMVQTQFAYFAHREIIVKMELQKNAHPEPLQTLQVSSNVWNVQLE